MIEYGLTRQLTHFQPSVDTVLSGSCILDVEGVCTLAYTSDNQLGLELKILENYE
jgi:hypothetical protein